MNWGKSILLAFVLFAALMAALVTICMRQHIGLVTSDYYVDELKYQEQIARIRNADSLVVKPEIRRDGNYLIVHFDGFNDMQNGDLKLFRPSDPTLDRQFIFPPATGAQRYLSVDGLRKGMYRAKMQWTIRGKEFFFEQMIYL
jgi:hypothetical protein